MGRVDTDVPDERDRLIAAAWKVLERADFEGFKVQLLLRETGLSARAFYRQFSDKDELLLVLMLSEYSRSAKRAWTAVSQAPHPPAKVRAWINELILAAGDPRRVARARLFTSQPGVVRRFADRLHAGAQLMLDPLEQAIGQGCQQGLFPWAEPVRDARLVMSLASSAMVNALADHPDGSVEESVAEVSDFALRALGFEGDS